jgi:hypothetical protein
LLWLLSKLVRLAGKFEQSTTLALSRLKVREDGVLTHRLKRPDRRGNTVLVLAPDQLPMRLSDGGVPVK